MKVSKGKTRGGSFEYFVDKAKIYLEEVQMVVEQMVGHKIYDPKLDDLGYAKFCVEVGKALPTLTMRQQYTLLGMIKQVDRTVTIIETVNFRWKHG